MNKEKSSNDFIYLEPLSCVGKGLLSYKPIKSKYQYQIINYYNEPSVFQGGF